MNAIFVPLFNIKAKYALGKYTAFLDLNTIFNKVYADYGGMDTYFSESRETSPVRYP